LVVIRLENNANNDDASYSYALSAAERATVVLPLPCQLEHWIAKRCQWFLLVSLAFLSILYYRYHQFRAMQRQNCLRRLVATARLELERCQSLPIQELRALVLEEEVRLCPGGTGRGGYGLIQLWGEAMKQLLKGGREVRDIERMQLGRRERHLEWVSSPYRRPKRHKLLQQTPQGGGVPPLPDTSSPLWSALNPRKPLLAR
jgi:hypothetical protein